MKLWVGRAGFLIVLVAVGAALWFNKDRFLNPEPFPKGKATWYVYHKAKNNGWRLKFNQALGIQANMWPARLTNSTLTSDAEKGSIAVFDSWKGNSFGHVGYVIEAGSGTFVMTFVDFPYGEPAGNLDGVPILKANVTYSGDQARIPGSEETFTLVGFLKQK